MTSRRTRERLISRLREEGITNESVLNVILNTPRHIFCDEALAHRAYEDTALPIGFNQTLSQPYIVARMTELLLESENQAQSVLEIGSGHFSKNVHNSFCSKFQELIETSYNIL